MDLSNYEEVRKGFFKKKPKVKAVAKEVVAPVKKVKNERVVKPNAIKYNHNTTRDEEVYATFEVMGEFPTLNDILLAKSSDYKGNYNVMKTKFEKLISDQVKVQTQTITASLPLKRKIRMQLVWYVDAKRKDLDNVDAARKFINDSLVSLGIMLKDNLTIYTEHEALVAIDKNFPRVVVNLCKPKYNLI